MKVQQLRRFKFLICMYYSCVLAKKINRFPAASYGPKRVHLSLCVIWWLYARTDDRIVRRARSPIECHIPPRLAIALVPAQTTAFGWSHISFAHAHLHNARASSVSHSGAVAAAADRLYGNCGIDSYMHILLGIPCGPNGFAYNSWLCFK